MRATEDELSALHRIVAEALSKRIGSDDATASDISNAIKFLKDNNISCTPGASSALDELKRQLEAGTGKPVNAVDEVDEKDLEDAMNRLNGEVG